MCLWTGYGDVKMICTKCGLDRGVVEFPLKHSKSGTGSLDPKDRRGVCYKCEYANRPKRARPSPIERFNTKWVRDPITNCRVWQRGKDKDGYGWFWAEGQQHRAHVWIFKWVYGYTPEMVCHTCDNPSCVSVLHLFAGNSLLNEQDKTRKNRRPTTNVKIRKLSEDQVKEIRDRYLKGVVGYRTLAKEFDVNPSTILRIVRNQRRTNDE